MIIFHVEEYGGKDSYEVEADHLKLYPTLGGSLTVFEDEDGCARQVIDSTDIRRVTIVAEEKEDQQDAEVRQDHQG